MYKLSDQIITTETSDMAVRCGCDRFKVMESIQIRPDEDPSIIYQPPVTQSLLARWLREVHSIIVWAEPNWDDIVHDVVKFRYFGCVLRKKSSYYTDKVDLYEQAMELALQEALKLLATV
jgi:hypothetical protein